MGWLDQYARGPRHMREVTCSICGETWEVLGHEEYGTWWPESDEDLTCPECWGEAE